VAELKQSSFVLREYSNQNFQLDDLRMFSYACAMRGSDFKWDIKISARKLH
jgi:hypothetical protein